MYWVEGNLDRDGGSNFTSIGASHASNNGVVSGSPNIDYHLNIQIKNMKEVSYTLTLDKFPRYEGYISINGGKFNTLY